MYSKKAWTPAKFLQVGKLSLNNFQHKRRKPPFPMKKMATKRRKKAFHMEERPQ